MNLYCFKLFLYTRQRGRFAAFSLYVSDIDVSSPSDIRSTILCYKDGPQLPLLNITITCTEYGHYVLFYNERLDKNIYPIGYELLNVVTELCEVVVKGEDFHILKCSIHIFQHYNILNCFKYK